MEKITNWLISLFRLDTKDRVKNYGYFEGLLSIILNLLLFFIKLILGKLFNSIALLADAFHTLSDVFTSFLVVVGFKISAKPPDEHHPFGHGRVERIFALLIAFLLIGAGLEFFLNSLKRLVAPQPVFSNFWVISILLFSILVKEFLTGISQKLGEKINSPSLQADAWHHRTDSIATALVLIGFIFYRFGFFRLDGFFGIGISGLIIYTGIKIIVETSNILVGFAPSPALVSRIKEIAQGVEGVKDAHEIQVHDYGKRRIVTIHISLKNDTHLDVAHRTGEEVAEAIKSEMGETEVIVHLDPEKK